MNVLITILSKTFEDDILLKVSDIKFIHSSDTRDTATYVYDKINRVRRETKFFTILSFDENTLILAHKLSSLLYDPFLNAALSELKDKNLIEWSIYENNPL